MTETDTGSSRLGIEFSGEWHYLKPHESFTIGRSGDLAIEDNPYLHRRFIEFTNREGLWTIANVGSRVGATLVDVDGSFSAYLRSGAILPLVLPRTYLRFGAGPTTYELLVVVEDAPFEPIKLPTDDPVGTRTAGEVVLTPDQRRCIVALAEPALRRGGSGASQLPASKDAAKRLGWTLTKFNRKLDNVCQKLTKAGVRGLHGTVDSMASNRRARLVEHSLASQLVSQDDLELLP